MTKTHSILDNSPQYGSVGNFIKNNLKTDATCCFVSAYFTVYAYQYLEKELNQIHSMRFLFGEPRFIKADQLDPNLNIPQNFVLKNQEITPEQQLLQRPLSKKCADWIKNKVDIKSMTSNQLIHGKFYHIELPDQSQNVVMGSSNFTQNGLGFGEHHNLELNLIVQDQLTKQQLKDWFDQVWNNDYLTENVKEKVLNYLNQIYQIKSPEFIYYKTLYEIFYKDIEYSKNNTFDEKASFYDSKIWNSLYEFQQDAVKSIIQKIERYNGCILADSVGLGKTYTALAVIKYFEMKNYRVLVLSPKKLEHNWTKYVAYLNNKFNELDEDKLNYTVLAHTDLTRKHGKAGHIDLAKFNWSSYDLVVVDESHNFRNDDKAKNDKMSRYQALLQNVIQSGAKTRVLLLSATPVNNNLNDLRNQIRLITQGKDAYFSENLNIQSINNTMKKSQQDFNLWAKNNQVHQVEELLKKLDPNFFRLLDQITIARSRKHIEKYYQSTLEKIGQFPKRQKPQNIHYDLAINIPFDSYDQIADAITKYSLAIFNPSDYILKEYEKNYPLLGGKNQKFTQGERERHLIGMMRTNFLKRLESSIESFNLTLSRTIAKISTMIENIESYKKSDYSKKDLLNLIQAEQIELNDDDDDNSSDYLLTVGKSFEINFDHLDLNKWLDDLNQDLKKLSFLYKKSKLINAEHDGKLHKLLELISQKIENPTNQNNCKVLIFTAFSDTADYLYTHVKHYLFTKYHKNIALVKGSGSNKTTYGHSDYDDILTNFSPISKQRVESDVLRQEIDILIATDCISEGQNLQDCDYLINYDIHWNPVRIIQRFGRIDRLGSKNKEIYLSNFWAMKDLDKYLKLKHRVESRMALVDLTATMDDNLLNSSEEIDLLLNQELNYRDQQLIKIRDEIFDLEDFNETVHLNDFSFEDYRMDLLRYLENRRQELIDAPLGLCAIIPQNLNNPIDLKGVIFCLQQLNHSNDQKVNPLGDYFLVYVRNDGTIRLSFKQSSQILKMLRSYCEKKTTINESLYDLFDEETQFGQNMSLYNKLIRACLNNIEGKVAVQEVQNLIFGLNNLPEEKSRKKAKIPKYFNLISWFVIK